MNRTAHFSRLAAAALLTISGFSTVASADPLFMSDFESDNALGSPQGCGGGQCYQAISGNDGYSTWPITGLSGGYAGGNLWHMISDVPGVTSSNIDNYLSNRIVNVRRYSGSWTNKALFSQITEGPNGQNPIGTAATQNDFNLWPTQEPGDFYISYWIRFQPGMTKNMVGLNNATPGVYPDGGTWRSFFALKTGTLAPANGYPGNDGDYRIEAYLLAGCPLTLIDADVAPCVDSNNDHLEDTPLAAPFWLVAADNNAGGNHALTNSWYVVNTSKAVPDDGSWKKVEVFLHRSSTSSGRFWMAIDNTVIADHVGPNTGGRLVNNVVVPMPINRIMPSIVYTNGYLPAYQWIDHIQVWSAFPPIPATPQDCAALYWCNFPYALH